MDSSSFRNRSSKQALFLTRPRGKNKLFVIEERRSKSFGKDSSNIRSFILKATERRHSLSPRTGTKAKLLELQQQPGYSLSYHRLLLLPIRSNMFTRFILSISLIVAVSGMFKIHFKCIFKGLTQLFQLQSPPQYLLVPKVNGMILPIHLLWMAPIPIRPLSCRQPNSLIRKQLQRATLPPTNLSLIQP